jgi:transposase
MAKSRRSFTPEVKARAVKLVTGRGKGVAEVARDLDLSESLLRGWKRALAGGGDGAFPGEGHPPAHEQEPRRLRAEVERLTMGRDAPRKATASFAGESS